MSCSFKLPHKFFKLIIHGLNIQRIQSINQSIKLIIHSLNIQRNQSINQSINQFINQSINKLQF